ncbi:MAG: hypothetical protein SGPRY_006570, partial [Prymnesium sp.]
VGAKEGKSSLREAKEAGSQYDDYEMLTRQLGSEMKAKPSDRLKSEEELLVLEANRLKQLEEARLARMAPEGGEEQSKGPRRRTDDDLVDELEYVAGEGAGMVGGQLAEEYYGIDEEGRHTKSVAMIETRRSGDGTLVGGKVGELEGEDEDESEGEGDAEGEEEEEEDEGEDDGEEEEGEEEEEEKDDEEAGVEGRAEAGELEERHEEAEFEESDLMEKGVPATEDDVPYAMECPASAPELRRLLQSVGPSASKQRQLLHHLVIGHHVKLKEANREKMKRNSRESWRSLAGLHKPSPSASSTRPPRSSMRFSSLCGSEEESLSGAANEALALYELTISLASLAARLSSGVELCSALLSPLEAAAVDSFPSTIARAHERCVEHLRAKISANATRRTPLRLQRAAPVPLKQYNPSFDEDFQPDKSMDPDRERAELQKLRRKTKKEHKGAIRELRKDAAFLSAERQKNKQKTSSYLEARGKRAMAIMQEQEATWKSMKKEKRKMAKKLL